MRKNYLIYPVMMVAGTFFIAGCNDIESAYNPDYIQEQAKEVFPVKNVDPNHTWVMNSLCSASVSVNETSGESYTIKVYTANPYNINNDALLLAKETVANGQTANFKFDIPNALQYVYVVKVNSNGYSSMKPVAVTDAKVEVAFGGTDAVANAAKTRAVSSIVSFETPDVNDTDLFPTRESIQQLNLSQTNGQIGQAGNYEINSSVRSINCYGSNAKMYVTENVTLESLYIAQNSKLYILPGVSLTIQPEYSLGQKGSIISVGTDATLVVNGTRLQVSNATIYNLGTIDVKSIEAAGNGYIYNGGTLKVENKVNVANSGSLLVNEGVIEAASFETQGSSSFYNSGETIISGKSFLSSTNQKWENQGSFKTGEMEIVATSSQLLNACKLYIDGLFNIHTGNGNNNNFSVDGGGYVECGSLYMDQGEVRLGEKAFVNVLGEAKFKHNTKGIIGIGSDYALLKMGSAVQENANQGFTITYQGNLYVACDNHFAQGHDGNPTHPYINYIGNVQMTGSDNAEISIPVSSCNPGYNSTPGETPDDPVTYTYAFEDMTKEAGDYDFNDVVLEVTTPKDGQITVNLVAAGAAKKLQVRFKKNQSSAAEVIFEDVHTAMGVPAGTLVNTGYASGTVATKVITVGEGFTLAENGDFYIADRDGEVHIPQFTARFARGNVPFAICVPVAWKWPKEYISIDKAYGDFAAWAQDATQNVDWYSSNWNSGNIME